jgi:uncharacterized protein YuzE
MKPITVIDPEIDYANEQFNAIETTAPSELSLEESEQLLASFYYANLLNEIHTAHSERRGLPLETRVVAELGFGIPYIQITDGEVAVDTLVAEVFDESKPVKPVNFFPETRDLLPNHNYLAVITVLRTVQELIEQGALPGDFSVEEFFLEDGITITEVCEDLARGHSNRREIIQMTDLLLVSEVILTDMRRRRDDLLGSIQVFEELITVQEGDLDKIDPELEDTYTDHRVEYDPESGTVYFQVDSNFEGDGEYCTCRISVSNDGTIEIADSCTSSIDRPSWDSNFEFRRRRFFDRDLNEAWGESFELAITDPRSDERFLSVDEKYKDQLVTIQYDKHRETGQYVEMTPHYKPTVREDLSFRRHEAAFYLILDAEHDLDRYRDLAKRVRVLHESS